MRIEGAGGLWSDAIRLPQGPPGERGLDSFMYVAYASDAEGTGLSLIQSDNLKWRAEIHLDMELENPTAEDFADKWVKYLGDDGTGVGDMKASVYDADGDGVATSRPRFCASL